MEYFVTRSYLQALSMVNYNYEEYESYEAARRARASGRTRKWLSSYRQVYIWTYGKLGLVVVSVGCLVVVAQVVLSVIKPPHQRSITELPASALAHDYQGELSRSRMEEKDVGKIPFQMGPDPQDGTFKFTPVGGGYRRAQVSPRSNGDGFEEDGRSKTW